MVYKVNYLENTSDFVSPDDLSDGLEVRSIWVNFTYLLPFLCLFFNTYR